MVDPETAGYVANLAIKWGGRFNVGVKVGEIKLFKQCNKKKINKFIFQFLSDVLVILL